MRRAQAAGAWPLPWPRAPCTRTDASGPLAKAGPSTPGATGRATPCWPYACSWPMRTMPVTLTSPGSKSVLLQKTASSHLPSPTSARPVRYLRTNRFPFGAGGQLQHKTAPVCGAVRVTTQAHSACCWLLWGCIIRIRPAQSSIPHKKSPPPPAPNPPDGYQTAAPDGMGPRA